MREPGAPHAATPPHHTGRWRHDLSNEVNALTMAAAAARHMLERGDVDAALANLERAEDAGSRCIELIRRMPPLR